MASLHDVVQAVLDRRGLDLEELSTAKAGSRLLVRISVDGDGEDGGGLTLDEVAEASSDISVALDESGVMGDRPYVLEVGTRGVDTPLTKVAHWRRNVGRLVRVTGRDGTTRVGRILHADQETVELSDGVVLSLDDVVRAQVQVEMNRDEEKEG